MFFFGLVLVISSGVRSLREQKVQSIANSGSFGDFYSLTDVVTEASW